MKKYYFNSYCNFNSMYLDLDGKSVKRTKDEYRYSYDPYVMWKGDYKKNSGNVVYSDRLYQWNSEKYNECYQKVWGNKGQQFYNRSSEDIQKFLSLYFDKEIKLTVVMEGCNVSNGFPYWVFFFEDIKEVIK